MATINKSVLPYRFYSGLDDGSTVKHIVNITDNLLSYKMESSFVKDNIETIIVHYDFSITLENLKFHHRFGAQTVWGFYTKPQLESEIGVPYDFAGTVPYKCTQFDVRSILDETWNLKGGRWDLIQLASPNRTPVFYIFCPNEDSTFSDMTYNIGVPFTKLEFLKMNGYENAEELALNMQKGRIDPLVGVEVIVNEPHVWTNERKRLPLHFAEITATTDDTSVTAGDIIPVAVTCADTKIRKIYLEAIHGVLDRTEVVMTDGVGNFNILTNTLISGDMVDIKIGHKLFSNLTRFTKTLT
jgi:hypothetical protein